MAVKPHLDKLEQSKDIALECPLSTSEHLLEVITDKMSPEQMKHYIREAGFERNSTRHRRLNLKLRTEKNRRTTQKNRSTTVFSF